MRERRSQRFKPSIITRWLVPAILVILGAALLVTLVLAVFLLVH